MASDVMNNSVHHANQQPIVSILDEQVYMGGGIASNSHCDQVRTIWQNGKTDELSNVLSGILERRGAIDERFKKLTSADILAGISFKDGLPSGNSDGEFER